MNKPKRASPPGLPVVAGTASGGLKMAGQKGDNMKSFILVMFVLFFAILKLDVLAMVFSVLSIFMIIKETIEIEEEKRGNK